MHNRNGMDTQKGTLWFTFYTKVRPWLSCVSALPALALFIRFREACMSQWWLLLLFLAAVAQPILGVIVFVKSRKDYARFVRFVNGVLIFEALNLAYSQAMLWFIRTEYNPAVALVVGAVFLLLGYFLWYRLNIQYFKKRIVKTTVAFGGEDGQLVECTACGYRYKSNLHACPGCGKTIAPPAPAPAEKPTMDADADHFGDTRPKSQAVQAAAVPTVHTHYAADTDTTPAATQTIPAHPTPPAVDAPVSAVPSKPVVPHTSAPTTSASAKTTYCRHCGSVVNHKTKICTGCGKNHSTVFRTLALSVAAAVLTVTIVSVSALCLVQYVSTQEIHGEINRLEQEIKTKQAIITTLESSLKSSRATIARMKDDMDDMEQEQIELLAEIRELEGELFDLKYGIGASSDAEALAFYETYVALIPVGAKTYHTYDCSRIGSVSAFWLYSVEEAQELGYPPCPSCH